MSGLLLFLSTCLFAFSVPGTGFSVPGSKILVPGTGVSVPMTEHSVPMTENSVPMTNVLVRRIAFSATVRNLSEG